MKKLIPALALLLVSAVMLATSSFAWFSMNTTVTVTGMEVQTKVGSNLSIAADTTANTDLIDTPASWTNSMDGSISAILEPVSTIDGRSFFYTLSTNVKQDGDAIDEVYAAYDPADTSDFEDNSVADALGYVDYAFQLKATNSNTEDPQYINLKTLNLAYKGNDANNGKNAFRVAIFVEKYNESAEGTAHSSNAFHALGTTWDHDEDGETPAVPYGTTTLMKNAGAANRTATKAVAYTTDAAAAAASAPGGTALQAVTYGAFNYIQVDAGETAYYKVVVRLWLEGEDTNCTNDIFFNLTDKFELDMEWQLVNDANKAAKANITNGTYLLVAGDYTVTATGAKTISAVTYNVVTGLTFNGKQVYTTADAGTLTASAQLYTIGGEPETATEVTSSFNLK